MVKKTQDRALAQNLFQDMAYLKIRVHLLWTTKNREPILNQKIRQEIFNHIRENAEKKGIYIDFINKKKSFNDEYQEFIREYKFDTFVSG